MKSMQRSLGALRFGAHFWSSGTSFCDFQIVAMRYAEPLEGTFLGVNELVNEQLSHDPSKIIEHEHRMGVCFCSTHG